jgi:hypothetical protein
MVYREAEITHGGTGDFVTLRTYVSLIEAEFDRAALEAAGLDVRLFDTGTAAIIPHGGTALGVRLQVRESEVEHARELLDEPDPLDESERAAHPELRKPKEDAEWRRQAAVDDDARRAFRASIITLFLCPGVGQLYAAWLLLSLFPRRRELSKSGRLNAAGAAIVIAVVVAAVAAVVLGAGRPSN